MSWLTRVNVIIFPIVGRQKATGAINVVVVLGNSLSFSSLSGITDLVAPAPAVLPSFFCNIFADFFFFFFRNQYTDTLKKEKNKKRSTKNKIIKHIPAFPVSTTAQKSKAASQN